MGAYYTDGAGNVTHAIKGFYQQAAVGGFYATGTGEGPKVLGGVSDMALNVSYFSNFTSNITGSIIAYYMDSMQAVNITGNFKFDVGYGFNSSSWLFKVDLTPLGKSFGYLSNVPYFQGQPGFSASQTGNIVTISFNNMSYPSFNFPGISYDSPTSTFTVAVNEMWIHVF